MENFTLAVSETYSDYVETIIVTALDKKELKIFGSEVTLRRDRWNLADEWEDWTINYGTCGEMTYEEKLPYVTAISKAMEILKEKVQK